jgi:hypothetical protein
LFGQTWGVIGLLDDWIIYKVHTLNLISLL